MKGVLKSICLPYILSLLLCMLVLTRAEAIELSDSSRVSLITVVPGDELYSCFGHSGIRITDYKQNFDVVFNYGTFDFEQPGFYTNFLKGHMIYMIGLDKFDDFRDQYVTEQRDIYEQPMNLNAHDRAVIFRFLDNNAKPENRDYRYDFLFDNCATRIRDVFEKNLPGVHFDYSAFTEQKSFRDLINDYSMNDPWSQFGMGLLIGLPVDRIATHRETTFLPDYLSKAFAYATIDGQPLCQKKEIILSIPPKVTPLTLDQRITPNVVFGLLLVIVVLLTLVEFRSKRHFYLLDYFLLSLAGIAGLLIFMLGAFTEHNTTQWNLNLFWALPTHLFIVVILPFAKKNKWLKYYFLLSMVLALIMVAGFKILPQHFLIANVLIAAIFAIRSYSVYQALNK